MLINKEDYIKRVKELLTDVSKLKEVTVEPGKKINLLLQPKGKFIEFLKRVKSYVTTELNIARALNQTLCISYLRSTIL